MKKALHLLLFIVLTMGAISNTVKAQYNDKNYFVSVDKIKRYLEFEEKLKADEAFGPKDNLKAAKANLRALKANYRATEDFRKHFKNISNVKWSVSDNAMVASFVQDGTKTNVVYNKEGKWIHNLTYSNDKTIPKEITSIIDEVYPGFDISLCVEVFEANLKFHIVQIESKKMVKQLGIYNGEINVISEYIKTVQ